MFYLEPELSRFITPILKSLVVPAIWLALIGAIYSRISSFFALNRIFFLANEEATLKTKQPIRFQSLFKVTKNERERVSCGNFATFVSKTILFPPPPKKKKKKKKWRNLISNWLSTASINYLNWPSLVLGRFRNRYNKAVIEPRVMQF